MASRLPRILPGEVTEIYFRCGITESDGFKNMNGSRIINLAEASGMYYNLRDGFLQFGIKNGVWAVTKEYFVQYHKPIKVFGRVKVISKNGWFTERSAFWHHQLYQKDKLCAEVFADVRVRDKNGSVSVFEVAKKMGMTLPQEEFHPMIVKKFFVDS